MVRLFTATLLSCLLGLHTSAQTLVTESGRVIFLNSLDSAKSAGMTRMVGFVNCYLFRWAPKDSIPILLDIDSTTVDSLLTYRCSYDNLFGTRLIPPDSSGAVYNSPESAFRTRYGIRLFVRAPAPRPDSVLSLLEYAVTSFNELKAETVAREIPKTFFRKPSTKVRSVLKDCKP